MKTLSIRQPWADLIIQGRKTLELRTWTVKYRGLLAIHASQNVERAACVAHGLDPDQVTTGAVVGVVDLAAIEELDAASYASRQAEHLADSPWEGDPLYGWRLADPRPLTEPVPLRGRMGLFEAQLEDTPGDWKSQGDASRSRPPSQSRPAQVGTQSAQADLANVAATFSRPLKEPMGTKPFELRVLPVSTTDPGEPAYRMALHQRLVEPPPDQKGLYEPEPPVMRRIAELGGSTLRAVADHVLEALRANGYKPTELAAGRREPFALTEETGVRLGLLFLAIRPITKVDRVEVIGQGIRAMTSEEAYYWYSKCTGRPAAERAQKALRVLLAEE